MAFATGLILIDAPASALNNLGSIPGARTDNTVGVKMIRTRAGVYPYVSAQAFRYWLRTTLEGADLGWKAAPIYREEKVAYTDANPVLYWDDDLFGYMRAPATGSTAMKARTDDPRYRKEFTPLDIKDKKEQAVTRISPFRVSTLVSVDSVTSVVEDFGTMSRHEGDPVPHEHQFYRTTLKGLLSLDLHASGTFSCRKKTGYLNLDDVRVEQAKEKQLEHLENEKSYRLPLEQRVQRVRVLFEGLARLEGGAKQTIHYTDVSPALLILAVTKGGNHIFGHVVGTTGHGLPAIKVEAFQETLDVFKDIILSDIYIGWVQGYLDEERAKFEAALSDNGPLKGFAKKIRISHPRQALKCWVADLQKPENAYWLD